jgi:DNA-binding NtrC family response regulator
LSLYTPQPPVTEARTDLKAVERETIEAVMRESRGNKSKAARRLGLSRTQLYGRLRKYDLHQSPA